MMVWHCFQIVYEWITFCCAISFFFFSVNMIAFVPSEWNIVHSFDRGHFHEWCLALGTWNCPSDPISCFRMDWRKTYGRPSPCPPWMVRRCEARSSSRWPRRYRGPPASSLESNSSRPARTSRRCRGRSTFAGMLQKPDRRKMQEKKKQLLAKMALHFCKKFDHRNVIYRKGGANTF